MPVARVSIVERRSARQVSVRMAVFVQPQADADLDPSSSPTDVLVVEDDAAARRPLALLLAGEGLSVREAASAAEAAAALHARVPDILITDITLADGSGYDLVRSLRGLPGGAEAAAVVVSGR